MKFNRFQACVTLSALLCLCGCQPPEQNIPTPVSSSDGTTQSEQAATTPIAASDEAQETSPSVAVQVADVPALKETIKKLGQDPEVKVIVVDIWSTSCIPCLHEFPNLVALSKKYPDSVACVSFNVDYIGLKNKPPESYLPNVETFLKKQKSDLSNLLSATPDEDVLVEFEVESIPAILLFDAAGELLHKFTDANSGEDGLTYAGDVIPKVEELLQSK